MTLCSITLPLAASDGVLVCNVKERVVLPGGSVALPWQEFPAWLERELEE